ncbi:hypothetical protein E24_00103 [Faustovirus]|nr:hypothetical protein PRJ_Fausto_00489 [Faustovirus]AMN83035.1 hypothetical protein E24_00103 [Faustovirus]AMN84019.1 hypothetical protein D5a_00103 [Faustovirus]AMN85005.1 hypothetical protein E23_00103 [Faustovirus]
MLDEVTLNMEGDAGLVGQSPTLQSNAVRRSRTKQTRGARQLRSN